MKRIAIGDTSAVFTDGQIDIQNNTDGKFHSLFPELPLIDTEIHDDRTVMGLPGLHVKLTAIRFVDITDRNDFLVQENTEPVYQSRYYPQTRRGNVFIVDSYLDGNALVVISNAPPRAEISLTISRGKVYLTGCGYGAAYGYCRTADAKRLIRRYYRHTYPGNGSTYILSNTWGGQIKGDLLHESFMRREIDKAAILGVDVVQIDDGWEVGDITQAIIRDTDGKPTPFKQIDDGFWQLDEKKFPHGLRALADYAASYGIALGIWFAPDCRDNMKNRERDLAVLRHLYQECGIRYFKLDMVSLETEEAEQRYLEFLGQIMKLGDDVRLNLDITDGRRTGYFMAKQYGTLFVENRYTHMANYYPHNTLKNLWMLCPYIPADKLQFEVPDCHKNDTCYMPEDPLAPSKYDIDYIFASVMLSNPLLWMSMQDLSDQDTEKLRYIINIYKKHRTAMFGLDIEPLGTRPDGISFCGFDIGHRYLLLFREMTEKAQYEFHVDIPDGASFEILASNAEVALSCSHGKLTAKFSKPRAFVFAEISNS